MAADAAVSQAGAHAGAAQGSTQASPPRGEKKSRVEDDADSNKEHSKPFFVALRALVLDLAKGRRIVHTGIPFFDWAIEFGTRVFSVVMKIIGPCLISLAHGLVAFCTYTFLRHAVPIIQVPGGSIGKCCLTFWGLFLVANAMYNYWKAICMDAGTPPDYDTVLQDAEDSDAPKPRQCLKCGRQKPLRTHHCSVCQRCVLKMDHHCPWINNCVGWGNYRHFCLFMWFLAAACAFIIVTYGVSFSDVVFSHRFRRLPGSREARQNIMTSFMICASILVALICLGGFHAYLVVSNQTTIEFQTNMMRRRDARRHGEYYRNPYDIGRTRNFQQVFGPSPVLSFRWMFPLLAAAPTGDGMSFASRRPRGV